MSNRDVSILIEPYSDALAAEILPLAQACFDESTEDKGEHCAFHGERGMQIEPDLDAYRHLSEQGAMVVVVLRRAGEIKGYVLGWSYRALHHKKIVGAIGDTLYVHPELRAYAGILVDLFLKELANRQVQIVGWPATPGGYVQKLLIARGFVEDDVVMEKRLCA